MDYKLIRIEDYFDGQAAKIVLNSPKANILEAAMLREILDALGTLSSRKELKAIVFQGEGKHFSFGASVQEHTKENAGMMLKAFHAVFYKLVEAAIPTVAVVKGQCLGGGMELALFCNFIIADKTAAFGQPEIVLGVFPPPASVMLPLKTGQAHADFLALTGQSIDATEAHRVGIVNMLASEGIDAWDCAREFIEKQLIPKSASCLRIANRAVRMEFFAKINESLPKMESLYLKELMETNDANEGINSFLAKKKPQWTNS